MPMRVRIALTSRPDLVRPALAIVIRRLQKFYLNRTSGQSGMVTAIQRFGSSMNLNPHFHVLALDGGYVEDPDGARRFVTSRPPHRAELTQLVRDLGRRLERLVLRAEDDETEPSTHRQLQPLSALGKDVTDEAPRLRRAEAVRPVRRYEASCGTFRLEAGSWTAASDRRGLERLCRYVPRWRCRA